MEVENTTVAAGDGTALDTDIYRSPRVEPASTVLMQTPHGDGGSFVVSLWPYCSNALVGSADSVCGVYDWAALGYSWA